MASFIAIKLNAPGPDSVAEHDLVSEVYYIMSGSGTLVLGPDIANMKRRPADAETVRLFNGPGNNGSTIRNGKNLQSQERATWSSSRPAPGIGSPRSRITSTT